MRSARWTENGFKNDAIHGDRVLWVGYLNFPIFLVLRRMDEASAGGSKWHPGPPRPVPARPQLHRVRLCHPKTFWGPPGSGCSPAPHGAHRDPLRAAASPGYRSVQFCIIKLPWLFLLETFTILCLAGKDDCSKPKLGINYTTTLHFSYKGKLCGKSCESTSFLCPPSKA